MAALTTCIKRHRTALEAAGVDLEALKARAVELRTVDGADPRVAGMTAIEEMLGEAETARGETVAEIERQGGRVPAFEYRRAEEKNDGVALRDRGDGAARDGLDVSV